MAIIEITDHAARALSRIITQFRDSQDIQAIVGALATEVQVLEAAINQVFAYTREINPLTIEKISKLVGARGPTEQLTSAQIPVNVSQGRLNDLLAVYEMIVRPTHGTPYVVNDAGDANALTGFLVGGPQTVVIAGWQDPGLTIQPDDARHAIALLKSAAPAGVRVILVVNVFPLDNDTGPATFLFDFSPFDDSGWAFISAFDSPNNL